jgi:hypothetical protein
LVSMLVIGCGEVRTVMTMPAGVPPGGSATCDGLVCGIEMPHPG